MQCRTAPVLTATDGVHVLFAYRLWNKTVLYTWKSLGVRAFSPFFAERLMDLLSELPAMVIVPVPPRPGKIWRNGWDQIEDVMLFVRRAGFTVCYLLERLSQTQQKKLDRAGRVAGIGTAYRMKTGRRRARALRSCAGTIPPVVCLVDDVITTGATLECCAHVLKAGGVSIVHAAALFMND